MTRSHLLLIAGAMLLVAGGAEAEPACGVPADLIDEGPRLSGLAHRLRDKLPVTIVAIGGASTAGKAAGNDEENAYPRRLEEELRRRHPGTVVTVINKGVARQTTQDMVDRFARDVYAAQPTLVIWETGTFDAVESIDVDVFANALQAGLADLREHNMEIILMNMQYSRSTASVINFEPYLDTLQRTADVDETYLFKRYEMMRYWSETGVFDFNDVPKEQRARLAAEVYRCLADRLADAIDQAMP